MSITDAGDTVWKATWTFDSDGSTSSPYKADAGSTKYVSSMTAEDSGVSLSVTLPELTDTTSYRCTASVYDKDDDPNSDEAEATDTTLVYAQNIKFAIDSPTDYNDGNFYTNKGADTLTLTVYGNEQYELLSTSFCKFNNTIADSSGDNFKPNFTSIAASGYDSLPITCTLRYSEASNLTDLVISDITVKLADDCGDGEYFNMDANSIGCTDCPTGKYKTTSASDALKSQYVPCIYCPAGKQPNTDKTACEACVAGKYATGTSTCMDCPAGSYSADGQSSSCTLCEAGKYQAATGQSSCNACPNGKYSEEGATDCYSCFGTLEDNNCTACESTQYYDATNSKCEDCGANEISYGTACEGCPPGKKYTRTTTDKDTGAWTASCVECDEGHYQDESGSAVCMECAANEGQYQTQKGQSYCLVAGPGYQLKSKSTTVAPEKCSKNYYSPGGISTCIACDTTKNEYTEGEGASYCKICTGTVDSDGNCGTKSCSEEEVTIQGIGDEDFTFPETKAGVIATVTCTNSSNDVITRYCNVEASWESLNSSQCSSIWTEKVEEATSALNAVDLSDTNATHEAVAALQSMVSNNADEMAAKDLSNIASSVDSFVESAMELDEESASGLAETIAGMAGADDSTLASVSDQSKITMVDSIAEIATKLKTGSTVTTTNIAMENFNMSSIVENEAVSLPNPSNQSTKAATLTMITTPTNPPTVAVFDKYTAQSLFVQPVASSSDTVDTLGTVEQSIDSAIVSMEFANTTTLDFELQLTVDTSADSSKSDKSLVRICKSFDTSTTTWSSDGCVTSKVGSAGGNDYTYKCACNHNTSFAIILSASEIADTSQSTASTILNSFNIAFLFLTFMCILPFKQFRSRRLMGIQAQLCISLCLGHIHFLVMGNFGSTDSACLPLVIIVQYLFLVSIAWSVCASVTLYDKIVNALKSYGKVDKNYFTKCLLGCWTAPIVLIVGTYITAWSMGDGTSPYLTSDATIGDELIDSCWIGSPWKWVGFMIPIYLCILLNAVLFVMVARIIVRAGKQGSNQSHAREVKALVSISVTACLPWILASLTVGVLAQTFQWLFIIVTGLQGPVMFICFVIFQEDVISNLFKLAGQSPPEFLVPPKASSKSTPSKSVQSSVVPRTQAPASTAPSAPGKQVDQEPEPKKEEENIYSKVDEGEDKKSLTNHGELATKEGTAPVEQDDDVTYENAAATEADETGESGGLAASYPHVPQLV